MSDDFCQPIPTKTGVRKTSVGLQLFSGVDESDNSLYFQVRMEAVKNCLALADVEPKMHNPERLCQIGRFRKAKGGMNAKRFKRVFAD